jgi:membrane associated rhomboid family serine protease
MIPLRDVIPSRTRPFITITLIAVNAIVFAYASSLDDRFVLPASSWLAVPISMFLHGSVLHFAMNVLCLWIFGDNVEDRIGHGRFLIFYLLCGTAAGFAQVTAGFDLAVPMVGANGAIAGIIGAYFVMYPYSRIVTLVPIPFFLRVVEVPAVILAALWAILQLASGAGSIAASIRADADPGIAFWAHVAGFATGAAGIMVFRRPERQRVEWWNDVRT